MKFPFVENATRHTFTYYKPPTEGKTDGEFTQGSTPNKTKLAQGANCLEAAETGIPIFTTFDSNSLYYRIDFSKGPVELFDGQGNLLPSLDRFAPISASDSSLSYSPTGYPPLN